MLRVLGAFGIAYAAYSRLENLMLMGNIPLGPSPLGLLAGLGVFLTVALMGVAWVYTHRHPAGRQSIVSRTVLRVLSICGAIVLVWLAGMAVFVVSVLFSDWH
ncbi:MAG TPA: hypothetical protein VN688_06330 [Gemmataceae bacterium]|nr:hypothetical protein [Gemmataceae bacterium]